MRIVLVGKRNGERVIRWPVLLALVAIVALVSGGAGAALHYLLTGEFSVLSAALPAGLATGVLLAGGIRSSFSVPVEKLAESG